MRWPPAIATSLVGTAEATFKVTVKVTTPAALSGIATAALAGIPYVNDYAVAGIPAPTLTVSAGALPPGLILDPEAGSIYGTPTTAGTYTFTLTADNGIGTPAIVNVQLTIT